MTLLYIIYALIGISIIIFIHEAGHFLAAKRVGVRVERFAVGFDPSIRGRPLRFFTIRWGETEYVLGMVPFGGYVKLAGGEMMLEPDAKPAPDELPAKSVGARALVFAAGSVMNIVSAFFLFMIVFTMGVPFPEAEIGLVEPGTPAWEAGLKPGDRIVSIQGEPTTDFQEVRLAVALGSTSESLDLEVSRPEKSGEMETLNILVTPRWNAALGFNVIGIRPADSRVLGKPEPDSPAARAGLRAGDEIVGLELNGHRLPDLPISLLQVTLNSFVLLRREEPFKLEVSRDGTRQWFEIIPETPKDAQKRSQIGVAPIPGNIVRRIQVGSGALEVFQPEDRLVAVAGRPVQWPQQVLFANDLPAGELELKIVSRDNQERLTRVSRDTFLEWNLRGEIFWAEHTTIVGTIGAEALLARAGLRQGDIVQGVNGEVCYSPRDFESLLPEQKGGDIQPVLLTILRDGDTISLEAKPQSVFHSEGVTWATMPRIAPTRGGPAANAGIETGAKVLTLGGKRLYSWADMVQAVQGLDTETTTEISWVTAAGEQEKGQVTVGLEPIVVGLPIKRLEKTLRVSVFESIQVGAKRIALTAKQIFLTLRSLISREVSAKNLSGPVGITHLLTKVAEQENLATLIYWLALISVNLGIFNLLPFPILDGGHLLFLAIEKIKGSPVSITVQDWAMRVAFLLIIFLAVFVTFNDIKRLIG